MTQPHYESWWDSLRHFGLLLSPTEVAKLENAFAPQDLPRWKADQLRRELTRFEAGDLARNDWVAVVLEHACGFDHESGGAWQRGRNVPASLSHTLITKENIKPTHVWSGDNAMFPVFAVDVKRIGVGKGRKVVSDCVQWLRAAHQSLALVTNGREWRLLYAGLDFDAGSEWSTDLWFEEGGPGAQLLALRTLLQPALFTHTDADGAPLLAAVLASRRGQAELSSILGERVREAVELLVQSHRDALTDAELNEHGADIYRAAVRVVMRLVVVLFAESRELLPRSDPNYHGAYGLNSLFEELQRLGARGRGRLGLRFSAWPRLLGLFDLIYKGSHHPSLQVPAYGGELFAPGNPESDYALTRALHVFESGCFDSRYQQLMPDAVVHQILELLTRTEIRIRQGNKTMRTSMPVDFSDLSSEYIGILYEGLLDYELRTAAADDPIVFIAVGNEPALPLARLEAMSDGDIKKLFESLKDTSSSDDAAADEADTSEVDEATEAEEEPDEVAAAEESEDAEETEPVPELEAARARATAWTRQACLAAKLIKKPAASASPEKKQAFEAKVDGKARQLVRRVILPGDWYLVRWGGTRKGSGTFYTRPALAVPTVQRTLRPLAYVPPNDEAGEPDQLAPAEDWTPKKPEDILALKVCDPACGSGSFPVAALRFLTDALYASLYEHDRLSGDWGRPLPEILGLEQGDGYDSLRSARLPCPPDSDDFEDRAKVVLRRYVVERCIYGVDFDPLASELCRLALWIETMDRDLPFSFLDHKIRCGNSLVGAWFDQFQHYPAMAWSREGGDKSHKNGVHFEKEVLTKAIKAFKTEKVKPDLEQYLMGADLLQDDGQVAAFEAHAEVLQTFAELHNMPVTDAAERGRRYREEFLGSATYQQLKSAMDLWCACWFWPADELEHAPLPSTFAGPEDRTREIASAVAREQRFFHWELEFPDVFDREGSGFDGIIGNPPWDIAKPNSKEFFSNIDPLYRSYGKQEALREQTGYFATESLEHDWIGYNAGFKANSNFFKFAARAYGDPELTDKSAERFGVARGNRNLQLHANWRQAREKSSGYADPKHPYQHQGSGDVNLYKLFLEQSHGLLKDDGALGFIVPSGLYSDFGTGALRDLFVDQCRWEWLFGFENREKIFDIHRSFKFNPIIVRKGGSTIAINTAFMRRRLEDWQDAENYVTAYERRRISQFSPNSKTILEIQSQRDLEIFEKIFANSVLLGDDGPDGWGVKYATEFHMTNDSKLFPPRPKWEEKGYKSDEYSRWIKGDWRPISELWEKAGISQLPHEERRCAQPPYHLLPVSRADIPKGVLISIDGSCWIDELQIQDVAFPFYQGRMIWQFDFSAAVWLGGKSTNWAGQMNLERPIAGQFLMRASDFFKDPKFRADSAVVFRDIQNATNQRTFIAAAIPFFPAGNKAPLLQVDGMKQQMRLLASCNSFAADAVLRRKMSQGTVNWFYAAEVPLPNKSVELVEDIISDLVSALSYSHPLFALEKKSLLGVSNEAWKKSWAVTPSERLRVRCVLDALLLKMFGLNRKDCRDLLKDCDLPLSSLASRSLVSGLDPKGFWRVDSDKDPELRHTVLTLVAFDDLEQKIDVCQGDVVAGVELFCGKAGSEGWLLPEALCLNDLGLGHDERASKSQSVASRFGPRFYDWQVSQSAIESWRECDLHIYNLHGSDGLAMKTEGGLAGKSSSENKVGIGPEQQEELFE